MTRIPTLVHGDCLAVLAELPDASVDAVVTDPPYGLEFMGKDWDRFGAEVSPHDGMFKGRPTDSVRFGGGARNKRAADPNGSSATRAFGDWCELWTTECLRVLKPGGHLLAFGGTRTWHRLAVAVEDAGFEMRDSIAWLYGSGFPKSLDVSKAIDKVDASAARLARAREFQTWLRQHVTPQQVNAATSTDMGHHYTTHPTQPSVATVAHLDMLRPLLPEVPEWVEAMCQQRTVESENYKRREVVGQSANGIAGGTGRHAGEEKAYGFGAEFDLTAAHTPDAERWQGWGTALKPAHEPVVVARKPLTGKTVAANVLAHGTGALNIDGCRVGMSDADREAARVPMVNSKGGIYGNVGGGKSGRNGEVFDPAPGGRWPANVVLDESQADALDQQSGTVGGSGGTFRDTTRVTFDAATYGTLAQEQTPTSYGKVDGASRFFYVAKAPKKERPSYVKEGAGEARILGSGLSDKVRECCQCGCRTIGGGDGKQPVCGHNDFAFVPTKQREERVAHPTVKPLALMRWLVRLVTPPGGTVLDPFGGSGATAEAAMLEGFDCIIVERELDYLPLIRERVLRSLL